MATAGVDMPTLSRPWWAVTFARKRQFAWKAILLAVVTVALAPVLLWKHALAAQVYLALLVVIHVVALGIFVVKTRREDIAPSRFGLFWRAVGLAVAIALLAMIRVVPDSAWFWPSLGAIWGLHTAGLALLHVRAAEGASCPFVPRAWRAKAP